MVGIKADNGGSDGGSGSGDESLGVESDLSDADESYDDAPPVWEGYVLDIYPEVSTLMHLLRYSYGVRAKQVKNVAGPSTNMKPTAGGSGK